MSLKIVKGVIEDVGAATALSGAEGVTGQTWAFVRFVRDQRRTLTITDVVADAAMAKHVAVKEAGRFAFYAHGRQSVLCGFSGAAGVEIATAASDPAAIAAEAVRTPAKRKIFLGVVLIPTIIGLFWAFDLIKAGHAVLRQHPAPRRPGDKRLTRALNGQFYWPL